MRTAKEMYNYSAKKGYGKGIGKWGLKAFELIEAQLMPGEQALICFNGIHDYKSTTEHKGNHSYAITNKRLILAQKKLLGENVQFIILDNINDITKNSRALFGFITFDTYKECFKVCFSAKEADNLYPVINEYFADFKKKANTVPAAPISEADELLKFKKLLDDGIISQDDFNAKKKQLLGI